MVADKSKKAKIEEENVEQIDGELVLSIETLQEIQDDLEKVIEDKKFLSFFFNLLIFLVLRIVMCLIAMVQIMRKVCVFMYVFCVFKMRCGPIHIKQTVLDISFFAPQ